VADFNLKHQQRLSQYPDRIRCPECHAEAFTEPDTDERPDQTLTCPCGFEASFAEFSNVWREADYIRIKLRRRREEGPHLPMHDRLDPPDELWRRVKLEERSDGEQMPMFEERSTDA